MNESVSILSDDFVLPFFIDNFAQFLMNGL